MKSLFLAVYCFVIGLNVFNISSTDKALTEVKIESNFTLINDTKEKVSIHTGTGFVSINKSGKTSIACNVGKEVRWAESGKKAM